jgi:hypothetical protein
MRSVNVPSSRHPCKQCFCILLLALCSSGCPGTQGSVNSLQSFAQSSQRTLIEVTDKGGRSWKVGSVEAANITAYFVISSEGRVATFAAVFNDHARGKHAVVLVDSTEKEGLTVLDRKFLSGVANASDRYREWLDKSAIFTGVSIENTRRIDLEKGGLGSSDIRVERNAIVGRIKDAKCHCDEMGTACGATLSTMRACVNKICDVINCINALFNGERSECNREGSEAGAACDLAL